ncbi:MAG TPA: formylmethanofuran--tetrahydromethanopterin N-formyltransferase [Longilinea sp.]|nr:formylmethanofuran--tetrahydromethanopterin N-formyltransferase [Longilinea sp.]
MQIKGVTIEDTFAEAFPMWASRLVITADTSRLALQAAQWGAGLATSIIGCGCEVGVGAAIDAAQTPDGRPGYELLVFSYSPEKLEEVLFQRVGQAILPSATSACFNGITGEKSAKIGGKLRYFGDGFQSSKLLDGRRFWRIPVSDGEFVVEESFGLAQGVGGGNLILIGKQRSLVLAAAEAAAEAICQTPGAIAPFPGGVCRSPSKIGSRYKNVRASTNDVFCPTLRSRTATQLLPEAEAVYELVIDGLTQESVSQAMGAGILAACREGMLVISAGNYGGKLGPYQFHLHKILAEMGACA